MYRNGFVLAIKTPDGKTLRETSGQVYLPFHTEYKLYLKNTHDRRARVRIKIDGTDVLGSGLVIPAYYAGDIERFLTDGNLSNGKKFKFVPLSDGRVADPTSCLNGLVEVEFTLEAPVITVWQYSLGTVYIPPKTWDPPQDFNWKQKRHADSGAVTPQSMGSVNCNNAAGQISANYCSTQQFSSFASDAQKGATVEGGVSHQAFGTTTLGVLESTSTIITLQLMAPASEVSAPLTTENTTTKFCTHCREKVPYGANYCSRCGMMQAV